MGDLAPRLVLQPVFGLPVQVPAQVGPVVLVFLRHLGCPFARAAVARLQAAFPDFDRAGVGLVGLSHCAVEVARDYVPRHHLLFPLVHDATGELRARFGVGHNRRLIGGLGALRPAELWEALAHGKGLSRGDEAELPAELVIGGDGAVRYAHYPRSISSLPDPQALLSCAAAG